ncbi:MAG: hypothetical protein QG656_2075 [Candidatus Hydrogenedentes bacterium]|nr:hypothetical protein [Candidatus Hydrogenedentota bacterium]
MKHIKNLSGNLPVQAMSVVELDGMFQKAGRMFAVASGMFAAATAGYNFWNLVTSPEEEEE